MEKPNRKLTWVHVAYDPDGAIIVGWVVLHWKDGKYIRKHMRTCRIIRTGWTRVQRLLRLVSYSADLQYTIVAYNGWSVCFETIPS